jgi:hypothetical protein
MGIMDADIVSGAGYIFFSQSKNTFTIAGSADASLIPLHPG